MSEGTWAGGRHENTFTRLPDVARSAPLSARASFLVAYERLGLLARAADGPTVAVAAVDARARVTASLSLPDGGALVIGRHTRCGLQLVSESVSLRHVVALARFEGGRPMLRVWDLRTGVPFLTEDQQPAAAVLCDGPLYLAIDDHAVWFLPSGAGLPRDPEEAWAALPARTFLDRRAPGPRLAPLPRAAALPDEMTSVTRLGPPLLIGEGDEPEVGWGELRLASGRQKERRVVSAERLEQGLLLGRYERCGLVIATTDRISRVHLMLVRIGAEVWAIDTGSTNGVSREGVAFVAGPLRDVDRLTLADLVTLDWRRTVHPDA
jgi:hypothetical protein